MKTGYTPYACCIGMLWLMLSCVKVIDIDQDTGESKIVIQGMVSDQPVPYKVKVTKTISFDAQTPPPSLHALVIITDGLVTDTLVQVVDGQGGWYYQTQVLTGQPGKTYNLRVETEGKVFQASAYHPYYGMTLDSLVARPLPNGEEPAGGRKLFLYAANPVVEDHYYRRFFFRNGYLLNDPTEVDVWDHSLFENPIQGMRLPYVFYAGEVATAEYRVLTKESFMFFNALEDQLTNDGGFFSTPPANVQGNISGGALGLFYASSIRQYSVLVP